MELPPRGPDVGTFIEKLEAWKSDEMDKKMWEVAGTISSCKEKNDGLKELGKR